MSIIIYGMDMPKNEELWIRVQPDGRIVSQTGYVIEDASAEQIPPHGRLIDADALISQYAEIYRTDKGNIWTAKTDYAEGVQDVLADIKTAPTVVEAEEER